MTTLIEYTLCCKKNVSLVVGMLDDTLKSFRERGQSKELWEASHLTEYFRDMSHESDKIGVWSMVVEELQVENLFDEFVSTGGVPLLHEIVAHAPETFAGMTKVNSACSLVSRLVTTRPASVSDTDYWVSTLLRWLKVPLVANASSKYPGIRQLLLTLANHNKACFMRLAPELKKADLLYFYTVLDVYCRAFSDAEENTFSTRLLPRGMVLRGGTLYYLEKDGDSTFFVRCADNVATVHVVASIAIQAMVRKYLAQKRYRVRRDVLRRGKAQLAKRAFFRMWKNECMTLKPRYKALNETCQSLEREIESVHALIRKRDKEIERLKARLTDEKVVKEREDRVMADLQKSFMLWLGLKGEMTNKKVRNTDTLVKTKAYQDIDKYYSQEV